MTNRSTIPLMILALLALGGCAGLQASHERRLRKEAWGEALLACEGEMRQAADYAAKQAGSVAAAIVMPLAIGSGDARSEYITLCMGDAGWTPRRPDTLWPWRQMTSDEQAAWPTSKAAIREYEKAREDSLRKP